MNMNQDVEILKCLCGKEPSIVCINTSKRKDYIVRCSNCGTNFGSKITAYSAIYAWNNAISRRNKTK